jgi:hypothetical protein
VSGDESRRWDLIRQAIAQDDESELRRHLGEISENLRGSWRSAGLEFRQQADEFELQHAWESLRFIQSKRIAMESSKAVHRAAEAARWAAIAAGVSAVTAVVGLLTAVGVW